MKTRLFGGKNDGEVINIKNGMRHIEMLPPPKPLCLVASTPDFKSTFETEIYSIETFCFELGRKNVNNDEIIDKINNMLNDTRFEEVIEFLEERISDYFYARTDEQLAELKTYEGVLRFVKNLKIT